MTKKSIPPDGELILSEFSRPIDLATLPTAGTTREIAAKPAELVALARRFGLVALTALTARLDITPVKHAGIAGARVHGSFKAHVTQTCVVSLEPFESDLAETIELDLLPPEALKGDETADLYLDEAVEPLDGEMLDIGELVAQHLSLALDPYPRRPGAIFEPVSAMNIESDGPVGPKPFAALGEVKRKM